jgi:4-amino-4-deoxy-L-arabinose transferase-like glycosyltransferase
MLHEELSDEKQEVRDGNRVSVWRRSIVAIARRNGMDQRIVLPALVVVLLCAALIRMYGLDLQSLEADEIFTIGIADSDNSLLEVLSIPLHNTPMAKPALYFLMTHFFLRLQDHDFLLRFPSMAFGVLGIAATYAVGAALFGKKEGLVAAFLLCISGTHSGLGSTRP